MRAEDVSPDSAVAAREAVAASLARAGETPDEARVEMGALLICAYPALAPSILAHPEDLDACRSPGHPRDLRDYERLAAAACGDGGDPVRVRRGVRRFATREKLRIAARELLAFPGQDVDVTARELALLAEVCCEVALGEAMTWAETRFGSPTTADGAPCGMVVVGAGKLGGRELNAGSDIDLILFYETDEGAVLPPAPRPAEDRVHTLHEHFTRVAQRMVATIDEATDDGIAWRVDLRLRPEGARGPLTMSLAAAERYYETWGRTWERAALLRARPIAGDLAFGARLMETLSPFVWRTAVDPRVAVEVASMLAQARAEAGPSGVTDLKIGLGGIREVEFFAQGLQLVWGGKEPGVRATNTLDALQRLRGRGFVTAREQRELSDAYLLLRRVEHRVHFSTGLQTHALPSDPDLLARMARSFGYGSATPMLDELAATRQRVHARFTSLGPEPPAAEDPSLQRILAALDARDEPNAADVSARFGTAAASDLPRHLLALAARPDSPLGAASRDRDPTFARRLVDALADAADPEQAARLLASFFGRLVTSGTYVRAMIDEPRLVRAMCSLTGASAFLGEALVAHPDLMDQVLYTRAAPTPQGAAAQVALEVESLAASDAEDVEAFVGALRRAKRRVTFEVGLADLAGELSTWEAGRILTGLADATLEAACRFALRERAPSLSPEKPGLAVVAMGKLGGREIGYGSDLDVFFIYEGDDDREGAQELFARVAVRVLQLVGAPHGDGPGYELDTRLRPSGNQGLLVASLAGFDRYTREKVADWERQALVKARVCAGDKTLGAAVAKIAESAAYERGAPDPEAVDHLRGRMEREIGHERRDRSPARYDVKVGRGGLVDVEFATQWLQMRHGRDARVRTTETGPAITALETCGYLDAASAEGLRRAWAFLRKLEQRMRVAHGASVTLLQEGAPGLLTIARSMGAREGPRAHADAALLEQYVAVTADVRGIYQRLLGLTDAAASPRAPSV